MHRRTPVSVPALIDVPTRSFGILSTFPPTACGIATFSAALSAGLVANGATVDVVRIGGIAGDGGSRWSWRHSATAPVTVSPPQPFSMTATSPSCSTSTGSTAGPTAPTWLRCLTPSPCRRSWSPTPSSGTRRRTSVLVLERVCHAADAVVVMTDDACDPARPRLRRRCVEDRRHPAWGGDPIGGAAGRHCAGIPPLPAAADVGPARSRQGHRVGHRRRRHPRRSASPPELSRGWRNPPQGPRTLRRGVPADASDAVVELRRAPLVSFDDTYRDLAALTELIASADLIVLPYDSDDQVTSGVLVDAIAAGRPVVSTAFPHAVETAQQRSRTGRPAARPRRTRRRDPCRTDQPSARRSNGGRGATPRPGAVMAHDRRPIRPALRRPARRPPTAAGVSIPSVRDGDHARSRLSGAPRPRRVRGRNCPRSWREAR